jgi:hypothetical protein
MMRGVRYVLMTWNPGPYDMDQYTPKGWHEDVVLRVQRGLPVVDDSWSLGTNWKQIRRGDLACLYRQGQHGRGIVAVGVVTTDPYQDAHWQPEHGGNAWYVGVEWDQALDVNEMVTLAELEAAVPHFSWTKVYASGRIIEGEEADELAALLGRDSASSATGVSGTGGQGPRGLTEQNARVEAAAMSCVVADYTAAGYVVEDVSDQNLGWDLEASTSSEFVPIEVKGCSGPEPSFFLTSNELRAAEEEPGWVVAIVTRALVEPTLHRHGRGRP